MKIEKIIKTCNECQHCVCPSAKNDSIHFGICTKDNENNFLFYNGSEPAHRYSLKIPDNCPLEDYTGTQTFEE